MTWFLLEKGIFSNSWLLGYSDTGFHWRSEGQAWPGTCPAKSTMFVPFMSRNLVRSARERLAYSQVPGQYE